MPYKSKQMKRERVKIDTRTFFVFKMGRVYLINKFNVTRVKANYRANSPNDFELKITPATVIIETTDESNEIGSVTFSFVTIEDISSKPIDALIGKVFNIFGFLILFNTNLT
jgi:hypothetical protein